MKPLLKVMWGDTEGLMLLFGSLLFVGERFMRWEGGKGWRVMRWQGWKCVKVVRWQGGKGESVVRQEGGRYLVLCKGGGHRMSPRFYLFVSDVNQENKGAGWVQDFLAWLQRWKDTP